MGNYVLFLCYVELIINYLCKLRDSARIIKCNWYLKFAKTNKIISNFRTKTGEDGVPLGKALDEIEEKKVRELEETIRMKNKQIQSLLEDIDQVEKESVDYQNKVVELRDQMAETTKQINAMTGK